MGIVRVVGGMLSGMEGRRRCRGIGAVIGGLVSDVCRPGNLGRSSDGT